MEATNTKNPEQQIFAIDWAHKEDKFLVYNGQKITKKLPTPTNTMTWITENIPTKMVKNALQAGTTIQRCSSNIIAKMRQEQNIEKTDENDVKLIYQLFTDNPKAFRKFTGDPPLKTYYALFKEMQQSRVRTGNRLYANENDNAKKVFEGLENQEALLNKICQEELEKYPIYTKFLNETKGIGVAMAAGLIAFTAGINRFDTISKLWAYFGYHVIDGKAPKKKAGEMANWHQQARSLCYVISVMFIQHRTPKYRQIYDEEKTKQIKNGLKKGHADMRARRKMVKAFLQDYWLAYRKLEGLPITKPYHENVENHPVYAGQSQHPDETQNKVANQ